MCIIDFMSTGQLILLFLLGLIVFGPKKLPEIARQLGKMLNELKRASNEFRSQLESEINELDVQQKKEQKPAAEAADKAPRKLEMPSFPIPPSQMNEEQLEAARQEFMAKNYGLKQPEAVPVSTTVLEQPAAAEPSPAAPEQHSEPLSEKEG